MKGTKALSFLLVFALLASLVVPGFFALPANAEGTDNGMRISKTATKNQDGSYTITLEAYATGSKVISEVKTDVPADIVLVLDQSGSMDDPMNTYAFRPYTDKTNSDYYDLRHNGGRNNLYYQLDDGGYASVSVVSSELSSEERYAKCSDWTNYQYYHYQGTLYSKEGDTYHTVRVDASLGIPVEYTYTFHDGRQITSKRPYNTPDFKDKGPLYYLDTVVNYSYTYSYTDQDGVLHEIGTSAGNDATPEFTLYERYSTGTTKRLAALKSAVTTFVNNVNQKAKGEDGILGTEDDVNHRVAVVGFASESGYGNNTELLSIAGSNSGSVGVAYGSITNQNLIDVLQNMDTQDGQNMVQSAINALAAEGATEADLGMDMANRILNANPVRDGKPRTRVVVFFTDGSPTTSNGFEMGVANDAIAQAGNIKAGGASVYSVGIFDGADATSAGKSDGTNTQKANWFMQSVSSNNGSPRTPSYYLSASDAGTLNSIFWQISNNIESGGSTTTLNAQSVIKDIISPQFTLPEGATANDITLETYKYTGENQWTKNSDAMGATATVNDDQVSVTGFNFSDNWCGIVKNNGTTEYRGNKLVISFEVQVKDGFLGGNGVPTNTLAGVYEDTNATKLVMTFPQPKVDIPINDVTVVAKDQNVYLLQEVSLTNGTTIQVGDVSLDLTNTNYGLKSWQTDYVDISVVVKDSNGNEISNNLSGLTNDSTYTVSVTVSPKTTEGTATEKTGNDTAKINVFKPVLTYRDSEVYYGASVPTDFTYNLFSTSWVHGETVADTNTMDAAPALTPKYTPGTGVVNGTIATKQDIPVDVTVKLGSSDITQYVTFNHNNCSGKTCDVPTGSEFLLHVKTCTLTITKSGGDGSEPYVFDVYKDGTKYSEVSIVGNDTATIVELPVGSYTIEEDTGWSWRYTGNNGSAAVLNADNPIGSITCTNTKTQKYWLNGFSDVEANIFGVPKASN